MKNIIVLLLLLATIVLADPYRYFHTDTLAAGTVPDSLSFTYCRDPLFTATDTLLIKVASPGDTTDMKNQDNGFMVLMPNVPLQLKGDIRKIYAKEYSTTDSTILRITYKTRTSQ